MRSDVPLRKQLTSCGDFKSPRPLYRCTFLQLKEKLLELGVSLMSSSEANCVLWETPGSWLRKGWVGINVAWLKGAGTQRELKQDSELAELSPAPEEP